MAKLEQLSEQDQQDIIEQSGVLKRIPIEEQDNSMVSSVIFSIPLLILNITFEYLVHLQFGIPDQFKLEYQRHLSLFPAIFVLTLVTTRFKESKLGQLLFLLAAIWVGSHMIFLCKDDGTFGGLSKTPGLITIGVLLLMQMDLAFALLSVACWIAFYYRQFFYQYIPNGSVPSLFTEL